MSNTEKIDVIILAAGRSSRFSWHTSKLLFPLAGSPLLLHLLKTFETCQMQPTLVLGHQEEHIKVMLMKHNFSSLATVTQTEQRGTADAVATALPLITKEYILIINGDMPLITPKEIQAFIAQHLTSNADVSIACATTEFPHSYGRVITSNGFLYIQEDKNCSPQEALCTTINAGIYLFKTDVLRKYMQTLQQDKKSGEFFLPDIVNNGSKDGKIVSTHNMAFTSIKGINTLVEAHEVEKILYQRIISSYMHQGVFFKQPETVLIDSNCSIESGTTIEAGVIIKNNTHIGKQCVIGAYSILEDAQVASHVTIHPHSIIKKSSIATDVTVGPFAHIHTESVINDKALIGNFVEIKKSSIGTACKAKHLSYLGDAIIGKQANIGAGTITCNYDGFKKHPTVIENNVSIGAHNALVAPITIKEGAMTAAGSTITEDVPAHALGIGRARQVNKEEFVRKRKEQYKSLELQHTETQKNA